MHIQSVPRFNSDTNTEDAENHPSLSLNCTVPHPTQIDPIVSSYARTQIQRVAEFIKDHVKVNTQVGCPYEVKVHTCYDSSLVAGVVCVVT